MLSTLYFFKNSLAILCCRPRPIVEVYAPDDATAYLPECLLIISNLFWNICFSVTCWISVSSLTMEYSVLSNRHSASSHRSSLGMRCWYFLERERSFSVADCQQRTATVSRSLPIYLGNSLTIFCNCSLRKYSLDWVSFWLSDVAMVGDTGRISFETSTSE